MHNHFNFSKDIVKFAEAVKLQKLMKALKEESGNQMGLARAMASRLPEGEEVYPVLEELENGIHYFYRIYAQDVNADWTMDKVNQMLEGYTTNKQGRILYNLMTAMICVGDGKLSEDPLWKASMEAYGETLEGLNEDCTQFTKEDITCMKELLVEQIEKASILFYMDTKSSAGIIQACLEKHPQDVEAVTMNTQEASLYMGAAAYILYRKGELSFLNLETGDQEHIAYGIGIQVASQLESDAVVKMAAAGLISWEKAKALLKKIGNISVTLLLEISVVSVALLTGGLIFVTTAIFWNFTMLGILVAGVISIFAALSVGVGLGTRVKEIEEFGGNVIHTTIDKVKEGYEFLKVWLEENILPVAQELWNKCRDFLMKWIVEPARTHCQKLIRSWKGTWENQESEEKEGEFEENREEFDENLDEESEEEEKKEETKDDKDEMEEEKHEQNGEDDGEDEENDEDEEDDGNNNWVMA